MATQHETRDGKTVFRFSLDEARSIRRKFGLEDNNRGLKLTAEDDLEEQIILEAITQYRITLIQLFTVRRAP